MAAFTLRLGAALIVFSPSIAVVVLLLVRRAVARIARRRELAAFEQFGQIAGGESANIVFLVILQYQDSIQMGSIRFSKSELDIGSPQNQKRHPPFMKQKSPGCLIIFRNITL